MSCDPGCIAYGDMTSGTALEDRFDKKSFNISTIALKYGTKIKVTKDGFYKDCTGIITEQYRDKYYRSTLTCSVTGGTYNNIDVVLTTDTFEVVK